MDDKQNLLKRGISGSTLKIIAVITMVIDHIGAVFVSQMLLFGELDPQAYDKVMTLYGILRNIGRTAFPIYCFLLVEGFYHTSSKKKYAFRLFLFALISEVPFDLALYRGMTFQSQNVFFTLLIGLLTLWTFEFIINTFNDLSKSGGIFYRQSQRTGNIIKLVLLAVTAVAGCYLSEVLRCDYGYYGVLLIIIFYVFRKNRLISCIIGYLSFLWEAFCLPGFLAVLLYNGKRGRQIKYLFYLIYPIHLLILYLLCLFFFPFN